jgi:hypothetical protein
MYFGRQDETQWSWESDTEYHPITIMRPAFHFVEGAGDLSFASPRGGTGRFANHFPAVPIFQHATRTHATRLPVFASFDYQFLNPNA